MNETTLKERVEAELSPVDAEQLYRDMIDETHEEVVIAGLSFTPSRIIEELDKTAFYCGVADYMDSLSDTYEELNGDYYNKDEIDEIREQIETEEEENED